MNWMAPQKAASKKIAWCTSVGTGGNSQGHGFSDLFSGNPFGHARHNPHGGGSDTQSQCHGIFSGNMLLPHRRHRRLREGVSPLSRAFKGIEGVPKPDVLVFNTNQCRDVQDWFAWYARKFDVPLVGVHTHRGVSEVTDTRNVHRQADGNVDPRGKQSPGQTSTWTNWHAVMALSRRVLGPVGEVPCTAQQPCPALYLLRRHHPHGRRPSSARNPGGHRYYKLLLEELEERVAQGVGAVDGERIRIYWEGMPVWGRLQALATFAGAARPASLPPPTVTPGSFQPRPE